MRYLVTTIVILGLTLALSLALFETNSLIIDKCITISSPGSYFIRNDLTMETSVTSCIIIVSSNVVIDGNFKVISSYEKVGAGILVANVSNVIIRNLVIKGFSTGLKIINSSNVWVEALIINDNSVNIEIVESINVTIFNNTISGSNIGIKLYRSSGNYIYYNDLLENNQHVEIVESDRNYWNSPELIRYLYKNISYTGNLGNYWDTHVGVGYDIGGCWRIPIVIDDLNVDHCPLKEPRDQYTLLEFLGRPSPVPSPIIDRPLRTESPLSTTTAEGEPIHHADTTWLMIIALIAISALIAVGLIAVGKRRVRK